MSLRTAGQTALELSGLQKKLHAYSHALALLYVDGVTAAPPEAAKGRGETIAVLSAAQFDLISSPSVGELLDDAHRHADALSALEKRQAELLKREYDKISKIPKDEYVAFELLLNEAESVWHKAKNANDYASFAPYIDKIVQTLIRFADYTDPGKDPYEVALDDHERGMTAEMLDSFFARLREGIVPLIHKIAHSGVKIDDSFLYKTYPVSGQKELALYLMDTLCIDKNHCALGETLHPFTQEFNKYDVRITTHYYENNLASSFYSVIHEGGHALYELGMADELEGTLLAGGVSMGIHESQSRLFENIIGRSEEFIGFVFPKVRQIFPAQLEGVTAADFYRAVNKSAPSLIRTEADELTYSLHIMVRYEIERMLFAGKVTAKDLPELWNAKIREYLGIDVPDNVRGVLQDSHWSGGAFGYFPSYAIGSAYAAQIMAALRRDVDVDAALSSGQLAPIVDWLTSRIYRFGKTYDPCELFERCCGAPFNPSYYIEYLESKYTRLYGLK